MGGLWLSAGIVSGVSAAFSLTPRFIEVSSLGHSIPAPSVRRAMFIARIGRNIRPPLGGPCPSVLQANKKADSISENTWPALLRRAERPTTRTINMTLLRRGGRSGQTPKVLFYCPTLLQYRNPTLLRSQKACYLSAAASVLRTAVPRELKFQVEGGMLFPRRNAACFPRDETLTIANAAN